MANETYGTQTQTQTQTNRGSNMFADMFPEANGWQASLAPEVDQDFEEDALAGFLS